MGIKGLWMVLTPYSEKKSLHEIQGQTLAVDLAGWVCDSQNVTDYYIQPKLYLRTTYLVLADICPIFVLEGDAPELKRDVMAERNALQFRGAHPKSDKVINKQPSVARKRFKGVLKECETLLKSMGVRCIKGRGEAEATCARLNAQGLVDAVVSQDSDCFAYGARCVYRNFSVSSSAGGGAMQGSVDCYDADKMYRDIGFGRNKMVALAILCGCDYGVGACGTAINTALSFLHTVSDDQVINRLLSWVSDPGHYEEQTRWASAPGRCDRCGHVGRTHNKKGCPVCATHNGCEDKGHKAKVAEVKRELSLRNRALSSGMPFPEPKVMKEFLDGTTEDIDLNALKIPVPSLIQFVKIMTHKLDWSERYCVEKFLPLLTKWHLKDHVPCRTIKPIAIKKKRNPRGIPSYEVVWSDIDGQYEALIPDDQFEDEDDTTAPWTTTERQDLMREFYSELVESYEESIKKPPKIKKTRGKRNKDNKDSKNKENKEITKLKRKYTRKAKPNKDPTLQTLNDSMKNLSLSSKPNPFNSSKSLNISVSVNKLKRKLKNPPKAKPKNTIDTYLVRKKIRLSKSIRSLDRSLITLSKINSEHNDFYLNNNDNDLIFDNNKENVNCNNILDVFNASIEDSCESDLSGILDQIISRAPVAKTAKVDNNLVKLIFNKNMTNKDICDSNLSKHSSPRGSTSLRKNLNYKQICIPKSKLKNNCSTPNCSPLRKKFVHGSADNLFDSLRKKLNESITKKNTSNFFDKLTEDRDAFEISVENIQGNSIILID